MDVEVRARVEQYTVDGIVRFENGIANKVFVNSTSMVENGMGKDAVKQALIDMASQAVKSMVPVEDDVYTG